MNIKECRLWDDVFDEKMDDILAPEIFEVLSKEAHEMYINPNEFFTRTYFSESIIDALKRVVKALKGESNNILTLYSLFGGGKTHTLLTIYHAFKNPAILKSDSVLEGYDEKERNELINLSEEIEKLGDVDIVVIHGKSDRYSARPANPINFQAYNVKTLWGYLAHSLGRYDTVRVDDDNLTVPAVEPFREILKGKKVIILIDEIIDYADNLRKGESEIEKRYTENIPTFLDRLSTALVGTNSVMVVSLPIEIDGGKVQKAEKRYDEEYLQGFLDVLNRAIRRVGSVSLAPLKRHEKGNDVVEVMKKRIFREIPEEVKNKAIREIEISIKSNPEVFGSNNIDEIKITYPYHPQLIEILEDIIERVKLQKTRDMLKYARVIVRGLWNSEEDPFLIMPYHIDLGDDNIRRGLFSHPFDGYAKIVERDIVENTRKFTRPELVKLISTPVLLKTYVYDSPVPLTGFPRGFDIAKMVYEPSIFMKNNWNPSDIQDALLEISEHPNMMFLNEKDGTFWFWRIANVNEQIDSETVRIRNEKTDEVLSELKHSIEKLTFGRRPQRKGRSTKTTPVKLRIFKKANFKVTSDPEAEIPNDDSYKLIVYVSESVSDDELYSLIYGYREGERRFKNTIVVMHPVSDNSYRRCEELTARVLACETVASRLNELYAGMPDEVKSIQKSLVDKIRNASETELQDAILSAFRNIAYPAFSDGRQNIDVARSSESAVSLAEHAYLALQQAMVGKIVEKMSFEALERYVEDVVDIKLEEDANHSIGTIRDWFRTNPMLPMVEDADVYEAIEEGGKGLKIGISNSDIWFKPVHKQVPAREEGYVPEIKGEYKVLSWKKALENQVKKLIGEEIEKKEGIKVIKKYFEVYYEDTPYMLREIVETRPDEWFGLVKDGYIIEREEVIEHGFDITVSPSSIEVDSGEAAGVVVKVHVQHYAEPMSVKLIVDRGVIDPAEGKTPFDAVWRLDADKISESIEKIKLTAEAEGAYKHRELNIRMRKGVVKEPELSGTDVGRALVGICGVRSSENLKIVTGAVGVYRCSGSIEIQSEHGGMKVDVEDLESGIAEHTISEIEEILGAFARMNIDVSFDELSISEIIYQKLSRLNNSVMFEIKKSG